MRRRDEIESLVRDLDNCFRSAPAPAKDYGPVVRVR